MNDNYYRNKDAGKPDPGRFANRPREQADTHLHLLLSRQDILDGLSDLVSRLRGNGTHARIQIVGGAALLLSYFDRRLTVDIDGPLDPAEEITSLAKEIAEDRNWSDDWINDSAKIFLPNGYGRKSAQWTTIFDADDVVIQVATAETLLAMKLDSAQRRGDRELDDITKLLAILNIDTADEAEGIYSEYYPGMDFTPRTLAIVEHAIENPPDTIQQPSPPTIDK